MGELDVHVLGPVEVIAHGQVLPLGRGTVTDLLAALAVSPNRVLPAQALAETVWHERLPEHPRAALQTAVARLRRLVGDGFIETLPSGYRFRAETSSLDLLRFEQVPGRRRRAFAGELGGVVAPWTGAVPRRSGRDPGKTARVVPQVTGGREWRGPGARVRAVGAARRGPARSGTPARWSRPRPAPAPPANPPAPGPRCHRCHGGQPPQGRGRRGTVAARPNTVKAGKTVLLRGRAAVGGADIYAVRMTILDTLH
jgi:hypothetical protein